jgi:copper(I)-binding protein
MRQSRKIISAAMLVLLISMASLFNTACSTGSPRIGVEGAQAVFSPLIIGSASVFLLIENTGKGQDSLVEARVDFPGSVTELHAFEDGKMQTTSKIDIPASSVVRLKPTGEHIMVYRLPRDIKTGATGTLTLVFKKSGQITTPFQFSNTP